MIFRRLLFLLAGATALAVSAGVIVVALAFALYALVRPYVGPAGGGAVVAAAAALLILVLGLALSALGRAPKRPAGEPRNLIDTLVDFVRSKPAISLVGALAAGVLAVRNPAYLGAMIRSFVEGREITPKRKGK